MIKVSPTSVISAWSNSHYYRTKPHQSNHFLFKKNKTSNKLCMWIFMYILRECNQRLIELSINKMGLSISFPMYMYVYSGKWFIYIIYGNFLASLKRHCLGDRRQLMWGSLLVSPPSTYYSHVNFTGPNFPRIRIIVTFGFDPWRILLSSSSHSTHFWHSSEDWFGKKKRMQLNKLF